MDTFARNEGEDGGKAHFKFVFTLDDGEWIDLLLWLFFASSLACWTLSPERILGCKRRR